MFHIIGFLFFFILIILIIGLALLAKIVRSVFGLGRKMTNQTRTSNKTNSQETTNSDNFHNHHANPSKYTQERKKIFDKDEGEYIDFEEIKE